MMFRFGLGDRSGAAGNRMKFRWRRKLSSLVRTVQIREIKSSDRSLFLLSRFSASSEERGARRRKFPELCKIKEQRNLYGYTFTKTLTELQFPAQEH